MDTQVEQAREQIHTYGGVSRLTAINLCDRVERLEKELEQVKALWFKDADPNETEYVEEYRESGKDHELPCPFCGSNAQVYQEHLSEYKKESYWGVECLECWADIAFQESKEKAIATWNRRMVPTAILDLRSDLRELAEREGGMYLHLYFRLKKFIEEPYQNEL